MRSPDEIKKGLDCCVNCDSCDSPCDECPYSKEDDGCKNMMADALAYIQQLETELHQLLTKCERLEREREALINHLKDESVCEACKHFGTLMNEEPCSWCSSLHCNFEWRGVKEE